jgi:glycosyltransferase involved in cell wall biosynthesis
MPKILYLVTEDWFFISHFLPMARVARDCGFEVVVATRVGDGGERLASEGLRVVPVASRRGSASLLASLRDLQSSFAVVRAERADIVHCIALRPVVIGGLAAWLAGAKKIILAPTGLGHLWLDRGFATGVIRNVARFVVSRWLRGPRTRYLFENRDDPVAFGFDPTAPDITIVGGAGVDPATISAFPEPPQPPLKVAVVSRMIHPKGIAEAVAAVQHARDAGAAIELHLFGDPDPANPYSISRQQLLQWSAAPGITWHGRTADVDAVWRTHHVAMLLSYYREGLPRALVEAAAAGRPIVTTDMPGCREVVRDGIEGILVPPHNAAAAGKALIDLAGDGGLRARLGAAAHARFLQRFTTDAVERTVRNLYRSPGATMP